MILSNRSIIQFIWISFNWICGTIIAETSTASAKHRLNKDIVIVVDWFSTHTNKHCTQTLHTNTALHTSNDVNLKHTRIICKRNCHHYHYQFNHNNNNHFQIDIRIRGRFRIRMRLIGLIDSVQPSSDARHFHGSIVVKANCSSLKLWQVVAAIAIESKWRHRSTPWLLCIKQ